MTTQLFVSYSGLFGGAERILLDAASGMDGDPVVACPEGALAYRARAAGLRTFPLAPRRLELRASTRDRVAAPLRLAALARDARELVRALRPDAVWAWGTRAAIACAEGLRGLDQRPALIFHNHDLLPGPAVAQVARRAARRCDAIVALSEVVARDLDPDGELAARTRVIRAGVDLDRFDPGGDSARRPHEALVLGAIVDWKRPRLALEAVALAARELPDLRLRIAGPVIDADGERILGLMRRRAGLGDLAGRVEFAGPLEDPERALREAGCLLHCADCEPYGMVMVEALAAATPVVAPAACGAAEIVDPSCGRHFIPGDPADAARALTDVLHDAQHARALGRAGRDRARQRFVLGDAQGRYRELVGEVTRGERRSTGRGDQLTLVTVIHNSDSELRALLASVERHLPDAQVVIVDSGSSDGGAGTARAWRGGAATVIDAGENVGYGRGSNAGVAAAERPVTVVLNPDVELLDPSLAELAQEVLHGPERLFAPLVVGADGRRQDVAQLEPGARPLVAAALAPPTLMPPRMARRADPWRDDRPRAVGWAVGACLVARTDTLKRLGPFDPGAFMYAEDLDLGLRAADEGIETWFWPAARVLHHGAHASRAVFGGEPFDLLAERRREVVRTRRGPERQRADDAIQLATFANRMALKALLGRPARRERSQLRALLRARRRAA